MDKEAFVPMQGGLLFAAFTGTLVWCGERAAGLVCLISGLGTLIWLVLAIRFHIKSRIANSDEAGESDPPSDADVVLLSLIGLLLPFCAAIVLWHTQAWDGTASLTGVWIAGAVCLMISTIYISSLIDRYLILPYVYGRFASPVWVEDTRADDVDGRSASLKRRRAYSKFWVAHRTACEIIVFSSLALILAVILIVVIDAVAYDRTLPRAIESIGGAGIAIGVLGYLGPRARDGVDFVLGGHAGLGTWVRGFDQYQREIEGYVVSVSVEPGVKLWTPNEGFRYLPLRNLNSFHDSLGREWEAVGESWRRAAQVWEHSELEEAPRPWSLRPDVADESGPSPGRQP
jgi:hypothetical protein